MIMKTTKQKIDEWIKKAPVELETLSVSVDPIHNSILIMGEQVPSIMNAGYTLTINGYCKKWEEENE